MEQQGKFKDADILFAAEVIRLIAYSKDALNLRTNRLSYHVKNCPGCDPLGD